MSDFWNGVLDFLDSPLGGIGGKVISRLVRGNDSSSAEGVNKSDVTDSYVADSPKDYGLGEYLEGLFASQGAENEVNRGFNSAEAAANRKFQHDEAQLQRDWYESMSSSAYQRAVADMKAAGLNPILAYAQGGASSAGTGIAAGSAASYNVSGGDSLSSVLTSVASVINALSGASAANVNNFYKIFKMTNRGK